MILSLKNKNINRTFFFTLILTSVFNTAFACGVPVCDIAGTIANLEKATLDARSTFLGDLYNKNKSTSNVDSLHNLHDFSTQSYELQKRLGDPENVVAWSLFLREISIYGLLKNASFDAELMKSLYDESFKIADLSIERQLRIRFDSYQRWRAQINSIMDTQFIYGLYSFLYFAKQESEVNKDEDYVIREANSVLDLLGKRLSYLYPNYEGVFEIKASCSPAPSACGNVDLSADRLVLLNSVTDTGIYSSVYSQASKVQNYLFTRTIIESFGTKLYSLSDATATTGRPSEVFVNLTKEQNITGTVLSSRYSGSLHFEGRVIYSPIAFYTDEGTRGHVPVIPGKYKGKLGEKDITMILRVKRGKSLMASVWTGDDSSVLLDFPAGEYVEHRGIVNLVGSTPQKQEPFKINMAFRPDPLTKDYRWTGGFFNTAGKFETLEMKRVSDIDLPQDSGAIKERLH